METSKNILQTARIGLFAALVAVLQVLSAVIPTNVKISLVLIPIVLGGIYFGPKVGAILGAVFGAVVTVFTVTGLDAGAFVLFEARPFVTVFLCFFKGILAGLLSSWIYRALGKLPKLAAASIAAAAAPIVNTGVFYLFMVLFFKETLKAWAGGSDLLVYILSAFIGINFLIEFFSTVILTPAILSRVKFKHYSL